MIEFSNGEFCKDLLIFQHFFQSGQSSHVFYAKMLIFFHPHLVCNSQYLPEQAT
jgi:hypothetical protein